MGRKMKAGTLGRVIAVAGVAALIAVACTPVLGPGPGDPDTDALPPGALPAEFSLLAYNVAGLPQGISQSNPDYFMQEISPRLNPYDIVVTQEDFDWWIDLLDISSFAQYHQRLRADVTHPYQSTAHPGPEAVGVNPNARPLTVGDGLGTISRFPFTEVERVPWTSCYGDAFTGASDCLAMKGFSVSTVRLATGYDVDVYNLHGEAGGTPQDEILRIDNMEQLATYAEANSSGNALILAGDTNIHADVNDPAAAGDPDTILWKSLLDRLGLIDTCVETSCPTTDRIDKVAYRDGGDVDLTAISHAFVPELFRDAGGVDLSDHEPLLVNFSWDSLTAIP